MTVPRSASAQFEVGGSQRLPELDALRGLMLMLMTLSTINATKKLSPRSATQNGNSGASVGFDIV
jgi:hypothetical protein